MATKAAKRAGAIRNKLTLCFRYSTTALKKNSRTCLVLFVLLGMLLAVNIYMRVNVSAANHPPVVLSNRLVLDALSAPRGSKRLYKIDVPAGSSNLQFTAFGTDETKAIDIYAKFGASPTTTSFEARGAGAGGTKMISIVAPKTGAYYLLVHAARGEYSDISLVGSYAPAGSLFQVGMHAHRLYNGTHGPMSRSIEPLFNYGVIRDWDIERLHDASVWKPDGSIDFTVVDRVYAGHARHGAKVIKTFGSVPTWASKRPTEPNPQYPDWPGAKSGPRDLDEYEDYVFRFVSHAKHALWAVEGWNEPYACSEHAAEFATMTPTELADVQKRLYRATKRVDPNILVFSPAQAYVCGIPTILNARTSQNEPIWKFFDALAWHAYNRSARGNAGPSYAMEIHKVRQHLANAGLASMPIADTEHGWLDAPKEGGEEFHALSDAEKGRILYETAQVAKSQGLLTIVWYGYDNKLLGMPMKSVEISSSLQRIYDDLNARRPAAGRRF